MQKISACDFEEKENGERRRSVKKVTFLCTSCKKVGYLLVSFLGSLNVINFEKKQKRQYSISIVSKAAQHDSALYGNATESVLAEANFKERRL